MTADIAVLVKRFPKLSETFVAGEIAELIRQGISLRIFSMFRPQEKVTHQTSRRLLPLVSYFDEVDPSERDRMIESLLELPSICNSGIKMESQMGGLTNVAELACLVLLIRRFNVCHVHAHYLSEPALLADYAGRVTDTGFSVSAHAKDIYLTSSEQAKNRISRSRFVATCTRHNADYLRDLSLTQAYKVHLVYHGIDTSRFRPSSKSRFGPQTDENPVILSVGRFKYKKGFDLLIDACALLREKSILFNCKIVGYGDQELTLRAQIARLGLDEVVVLHPPVDERGINSLLQQATVFVLPCRVSADGDRDGIPNSLLEAMACGLPVVSTAVSGIPEIVCSEKNGLLVEPEDPRALAQALERIMNNRPMAIALGKRACVAVSEAFDWSSNVAPLAKRLHEIVNEHLPQGSRR